MIADLNSAPESYPKALFKLSDTKFLLDGVIITFIKVMT